MKKVILLITVFFVLSGFLPAVDSARGQSHESRWYYTETDEKADVTRKEEEAAAAKALAEQERKAAQAAAAAAAAAEEPVPEEPAAEEPDPEELKRLTEEEINEQIRLLNGEIQSNRERVKKIQNEQKKYQTEIEAASHGKASLNNQLAIINNRVTKAELDMESISTDIDRMALETEKTNLARKHVELKIANEKNDLAGILRLISRQDRATTLEIMLANNSLAEFLSQVKYLEDLNEEISGSLKDLEKHGRDLAREKVMLEKQTEELKALRAELEKSKTKLQAEKENKIVLINQLDITEREYQRLLERAKAEQEAAAAEIVTMEKQVREKFAQLEGKELEFNDQGLAWPVPKNVITSYFHDPEYPFRYIFEHPGVDIRAGQGTTLKAAASGYVARAKNGGRTGYSYIMIVHGDGLSTVYGHVSEIGVKEEEYVVQGQKIGRSGGLPGTPGAGSLTTGPHLHFEVRLNGIPVDPLAYLP